MGKQREGEVGMKEEAKENQREEALASNPCLQPNFRSASLTQSQISKFQKLHRKHLRIKAKSNKQKNHKVQALKLPEDDLADKDKANVGAVPADPTVQSTFGDCNCPADSSVQPGKSREQSVLRTCQKLYWGLDVKERWERKSNL